MSASNRSTNGHRFVFHSFEVSASERHYVAGEPGVIPYQPPPPPLCPAVRAVPSSAYPSSVSINGPPIRLSHADEYHQHQNGQYSEHLPTTLVDADEGSLDEWGIHISSSSMQSFGPVRSPVPTRILSPPRIPRQTPPRSPSPIIKLKAGDMLYWHHLSRHGELPGVQEDPRARGKGTQQRSFRGTIHNHDELNNDISVRVAGMAVVCGR